MALKMWRGLPGHDWTVGTGVQSTEKCCVLIAQIKSTHFGRFFGRAYTDEFWVILLDQRPLCNTEKTGCLGLIKLSSRNMSALTILTLSFVQNLEQTFDSKTAKNNCALGLTEQTNKHF